MIATTSYLSIFFQKSSKLEQIILKNMNKSQLTLYIAAKMTNGSRKEPQKCKTLKELITFLNVKTQFSTSLPF
jgi:hypothetical protein